MNQTKEQFLEAYKTYRDTMPDGMDDFIMGRIEPLVYEIPFRAKVLDIGCNSGEVMKLLREKRECDVQGIDVSEVAIAKAKEKGLAVQIADAENLPFDDNEFDVVLMTEILHELHEPEAVLREAKRVLKPEGVLLGSVPHKNLEKYVWEDLGPHQPYFELDTLGELIDKVFKHGHLWPLKGAQLSVKFASTFLAGLPTEILFKCGSSGLSHPWWSIMANKDVLRVWFGPTQAEGDVYYRMRGFADKMREKGIEAAYEHFDYKNSDSQSQWQNRCRNSIVLNQLDAILKVADISVWQLVMNADALAFLRCWRDIGQCKGCLRFRDLRKSECERCKATGYLRKPVITEIDDWMLDLPQYNIASGPFKPGSPHEWFIYKQLEISDAIIASTEFIVEKIKEIESLREKTFYIVPNSIDFAIWEKLKEPPLRKPADKIRIGYSGCGNHGGDLHLIRESLKAILDEFPNVEFVYAVHMKDPHDPDKDFDIIHPQAKCINEWYTIEQFPQALKNWDLDIGIAPLVDNNFNRAKSNLRWLEYGALKLPCVASPVVPFKKSIRHNEDGLLCRSSLEWYEALKKLILSVDERKRLGENAYKRVQRDFNMDNVADRYARILEEIKRHAGIGFLRGDRTADERPGKQSVDAIHSPDQAQSSAT